MARQPIDVFGRVEFEEALNAHVCHRATGAPLWRYFGIVQGEHCYRVDPFPGGTLSILVRSSIKADGVSAPTAKDSIRPLCVVADELDAGRVMYHGGKLGKYITRLPGWGERMGEQLRRFATLLLWCRKCPYCQAQFAPFTTRKEDSPNKGRDFVSCPNRCKGQFAWVEAEDGTPWLPPADWHTSAFTSDGRTSGKDEKPVACPQCKAVAVMPSIKGAGFHCFKRKGGCGAVLASLPNEAPEVIDYEAEGEVLMLEQMNAEARGTVNMSKARVVQRADKGENGQLCRTMEGLRPPTTTPTTRASAPNPNAPQPQRADGFTVDLATLRAKLIELGAKLEQLDGSLADDLAALIS